MHFQHVWCLSGFFSMGKAFFHPLLCVPWYACGWLESHWLWNRLVVMKDSASCTSFVFHSNTAGLCLVHFILCFFLFLKGIKISILLIPCAPAEHYWLYQELYLFVMLGGWPQQVMSALFICSCSSLQHRWHDFGERSTIHLSWFIHIIYLMSK